MGCGGRRREESIDVVQDGVGHRKIYVAKSFSLSVIDWLHVASLYVPYILTAFFVFAVSCLIPPAETSQLGGLNPFTERPTAELQRLSVQLEHALAVAAVTWSHVSSLWYAYLIFAACVYYVLTSRPSVYLMDFAVYEAPAELQVSRGQLVDIMNQIGVFTPDSINFMTKLLNNSGTGEATAWPPGTVRTLRALPSHVTGQPVGSASGAVTDSNSETGHEFSDRKGVGGGRDGAGKLDKPDTSLAAARAHAEAVLTGCMETLIARSGVKPRDVDFLIVNCSLFGPTPSLASIITKKFGMSPTLRSYNLGGMGCSASLISIDLAKQLLENRPHSLAVVLSTEEITQSLYNGNDRGMLVQNTLFRVGGAAMLLSNRPIDGFRARYKLLHTVRVQDMTENGHGAVIQQEDTDGVKGIFLSKDITTVAGKALKDNLTILGPQVLPLREQVRTLSSLIWRRVSDRLNAIADSAKVRIPCTASGRIARTPIYVPDFKAAISHFCIHAGGRAVIEGIEKNLSLERYHTAPSRATLFHFGNTSSSSIWYELRYCEGEEGYWKGKDRERERSSSVSKQHVTPTSSAGPASPVRSNALAGARSSPSPQTVVSSGTVSGAAASASVVQAVSEAVPEGWDPARKWHLPDYERREVAAGDRVLQIAFGSGFKCNSAVWLRMR